MSYNLPLNGCRRADIVRSLKPVSLVLVHSDRFAEHQTPPGHPERPERAEVMDAVADRWRQRGTEIVAPRAATTNSSRASTIAHTSSRARETAGRSRQLDSDTYTSPESHETALLAAGAAIDARRAGHGRAARATPSRWCARPATTPSAIARWASACSTTWRSPRRRARGGRRAGRDRRLGRPPRQRHAAHLRGRRDVLYLSTHQYPYLPGHRRAATRSGAARARLHRQLPLAAGPRRRRLPRSSTRCSCRGAAFEPDLILVSAGFDAHERDPLADMRVTERGFAAMTRSCAQSRRSAAADGSCSVLEGGYDLQALASSLDAVIAAHAAVVSAPVSWPSLRQSRRARVGRPSRRYRRRRPSSLAVLSQELLKSERRSGPVNHRTLHGD